MFIKGPVFKLILGSLITLGLVAAATVVYMSFIKPNAPTNLYIIVPNVNPSSSLENCEPVVNFYDMSQNESEFRIYRRKLGAATFAMIQALPARPGNSTWVDWTDTSLPLGTYEYKVSSYNNYGESFSNIAKASVIYSTKCTNLPYVDPSTLPANPVILSLTIIKDCSVRISYLDNSTNEQGFKIIRMDLTTSSGFIVINTLGPHAGVPGTYDDNTRLPVGLYGYRIGAFNAAGTSWSGFYTIDVISECNPGVKFGPTVDALAIPTSQKQSAEPCIWQAASDVFLRTGPDVGVYPRLISEPSGAILPIVGQSEDGQFWALEAAPGVIGYISKAEKYSQTSGDCTGVPTLTDPPPPVVVAPPEVPTEIPAASTATPCPVGAVCP